MSLNWDVSAVKDGDTICWIEATEDDPMHGIEAGKSYMNPLTNVLIWATIAVDLPGITRENCSEFYARLHFVERLDGPLLIRAEVDGVRPEGSAAFITPEEVVAHIGLKANVTPLSRTRWLNKLKHSFDGDLNRYAFRVVEIHDAAHVND